MLLPAALAGLAAGVPAGRKVPNPRVVVLGIDGMDPRLLERFVSEGRMPHFADLMQRGGYARLGTSVPPQSPVAWSDFITGMDGGGHGIFDFIHRDPARYAPVFSAARVEPPRRILKLGRWRIPLSGGKTELLRRGEAFWQILDRHGVSCTVIRIPSNFPPLPFDGRSLSGMGTPDLLGTYGTFTYFTDDSSFFDLPVSGGRIVPVRIVGGRAETRLEGPPNTFLAGSPPLSVPVRISVDPVARAAEIVVGEVPLLLAEGEWSDWVEVAFPALGPLHHVKGIVRFHLRSAADPFALYASPINIDPASPALPISTPGDYAPYLARRIGSFYTQGMPEDTKALEWGVLDDHEFVHQAGIVLGERLRLLDAVLDDYSDGLLFFYFSTLDQSTHMLYRFIDPDHPAHEDDPEAAAALGRFYAVIDSVLGVVEERLPEGTVLLVMSDHGFAPYRKRVNLNTWLYEQGYLVLKKPGEIGRHPLFGNVRWRRTRAYALGINGIYLNLRGREAKGAVPPRMRKELLEEISGKLLELRDPETGEPVVARVYRSSEIYHGPYRENAPDLVVGFYRGYRVSDESALGQLSREVIEPNGSKWSGDHCMAAEEVPGILVTNRPLKVADPKLTDLAPTILELFGVEPPPQMSGRNLFGPVRVSRKR
jgi:predicted AlkP superfamily phosphohydrolase/phosphomutase